MAAVERTLEAEQNIFRKQSSGSSSALRASCRVVYLLTKKMFATHSTRDLSTKETVLNTANFVSCNMEPTD
jgi:hypothetical protein